MQSELRPLLRATEALLREWDPIGVIHDLVADGLEPNEYDSYAPHILGMLHSGVSGQELTKHLADCRTLSMGLSERCTRRSYGRKTPTMVASHRKPANAVSIRAGESEPRRKPRRLTRRQGRMERTIWALTHRPRLRATFVCGT